MITVDGEAIISGPDQNDSGQGEGEALRTARLELKLCKAFAALNPSPDCARPCMRASPRNSAS
jgi:hypothetical protein